MTAELAERRALPGLLSLRTGVRPLVGRAQPVLRRVAPALGAGRRAGGVVSPAGWGLLGVSLLALQASTTVGWTELRVLALAGLGTLIGAAAFTIGRSTYAVALDLHATRVVVGERAVGRVAVTNEGTRRTLPARIELPVGPAAAGFDLPALAAGAAHEDLFAIPTQRRAVIVVGPVRSTRGDPFRLLRREVLWTDPVDLYVHPRTVRLEGSAAGFIRDLEGRPTKELSNNDVSFHALRPYVPGDDRRYVHWRTSARTGTWMVRQFEETRRSHLVVALSTAAGDYVDDDEFELAVSASASLGMQALRDEKALSVVTSRGRLRIGSTTRLLDDLTELETGRTADLRTLARRTSQEVLNATVVVLVCGSAGGPAEVRVAGSQFGLDVRVVVLRAATGQASSCRTVGAATVLTVGDLGDLPSAVRRAGSL